MIKPHGHIKFAIAMEYIQLLFNIGVTCYLIFSPMREYLEEVLRIFVIVSVVVHILLNIRILQSYREMHTKSNTIDTVRFNSETDQIYDGGQSAILN